MSERFATVALDVPLARLFDYRLPPGLAPMVGQRIVVPFGKQVLSGIVVAVHAQQPALEQVRDALLAPSDMPALPEDVLALCRFCTDYYAYPFGAVLAAAVPGVFRLPRPWAGSTGTQAYVATDAAALLAQVPARARKQRALAQALAQPQSVAAIRQVAGDALRWVQGWLAQGLVAPARLPAAAAPGAMAGEIPLLNPEQQAAVAAIDAAQGFAPLLLYGITGSGKTEVYLRTIATARQRGQQVLVLVPEINLTPQLEARFRARFPHERIVSLHSGLADGERVRHWLAAAQGEAGVVLGTRLAIFTPLPALGLIIIDEEHDASYRQAEGFRYSARDVAVYRARLRQVPVVLGSATPGLESWKNARDARYRLLQLRTRAVAGARPPRIELLPTQRQRMHDGLAEPALQALREVLAAGRQALVFVNRRGYAPVLACHDCGWISACPQCSARLVLHLADRRLRCHHCGHEERVPAACPDCGNQDLKPLGQGSQRVESALAQLFPQANVLRIDRDSTRRKGALGEMLQQAHTGEADLLVGTQMLAKGHDFPGLDLVVVLNADNGLFSVDFRAEERLFAQLLQVAGRAGRAGQAGRVLIQTQYPEHPFYAALVAGDYAAFADAQLAERRSLALPPYAAWAIVRAQAREQATALAFLREAAAQLAGFPIQVAEPVPAAMARKAGWERAHVVLSAPGRAPLQVALRHLAATLSENPPRGVRWLLDVDPHEF
ncbi:primosomal protein N' [Chitiniphilus purpureus]|uniref:Replication restart protein PriA n=1 Tax=Chitiniphilus purpureus TaxID=2981137 RepID=A0ABY6DRQ7_9NEIS|nr:primosomal protein N' [Chitiniphilus sp. CD1]UXY17054.1 primosomal protein N' [Chitiniphilus sp. CD1]